MIKSTKIYFSVIAFIMIVFVVFGFFVKNSHKGERDFNSLLKKIDLDNIVVYIEVTGIFCFISPDSEKTAETQNKKNISLTTN